jgi:NAD(P)-dependent dehydrogenase (short-subunit alcohol dehydrogenase family)
MPVGSICLVTGASGTIGLAIAKSLVKGGAEKVILTGRSLDKLQRAAEQIASSAVHCMPCDVANEASVENLFQQIDQEAGKLNLLVNNAGINAPGATIDLKADDFRRVMDTNVVGPFLCAREAIKRMKSNGGGRIINIGSLSAGSPRPDSAPYTTSKFALAGLTQSLALDCRADNIAVGIIHPGNVESDLLSEEVKAGRIHEGFLAADQIADCVLQMARLPYESNILEMTLAPTLQPYVGRG